jgi:hypothetical protein
VGTGFPKRSCSIKKIERDDDSKKVIALYRGGPLERWGRRNMCKHRPIRATADFLTFLWWRRSLKPARAAVNRSGAETYSIEWRATIPGRCALNYLPQKKDRRLGQWQRRSWH